MAKTVKGDFKIDVEHINFASKYKPHQRALEVHDRDPEYEYRWVRDTPERLETAQRTGYVLVSAGEVKTIGGAGPDGKIRAGGKHVLVRRRKEIGESHREFLRRKAADQTVAPRQSFKNKAAGVNVKSVDVSEAILGPPSASIPDSDD